MDIFLDISDPHGARFLLIFIMFWGLSSVMSDINPSIREIIHNTQLVLLNARVAVL